MKRTILTLRQLTVVMIIVAFSPFVSGAQTASDGAREFVPLANGEQPAVQPEKTGTRFRTELFHFRNPFKRKSKTEDTRPLTSDEMIVPLLDSGKSTRDSGRPERSSKTVDEPIEKSLDQTGIIDADGDFKDSFLGELEMQDKPDYNSSLKGSVSTNMQSTRFDSNRANGGIHIGRGAIETDGTSGSVPTHVSTFHPNTEPSDFLPPNPAVEPDKAALDAYAMAVRIGQTGDYERMAQELNKFVTTYPNSKMTPRALYLLCAYEKDKLRRQALAIRLLRDHSTSKYVNELERRDIDLYQTANSIAGVTHNRTADAVTSGAGTSDIEKDLLQRNVQLEQALLRSPTVSTKIDLAENCLRIKNYTRAENLLLQLKDPTQGTDYESRVLDVLSQVQMELGQMDEARINMDTIIRSMPQYKGIQQVRLNMGDVCEKVGNRERAITEYRTILEQANNSPDAKIARERLIRLKAQ